MAQSIWYVIEKPRMIELFLKKLFYKLTAHQRHNLSLH